MCALNMSPWGCLVDDNHTRKLGACLPCLVMFDVLQVRLFCCWTGMWAISCRLAVCQRSAETQQD